MKNNSTHNFILERIKNLEEAIIKERAFLESGAHADWHGFHAVFTPKTRDGEVLPPHKDWVRNVFLPSRERALGEAERVLERLSFQAQKKRF